MVLFTPTEIFEAIALSIIVGWIFKDAFHPGNVTSPEQIMRQAKAGLLNKDAWIFASLLVAPAIILHELGHKFVALSFGLSAEFNAAWFWVAFAVLMKLMSGFIFFVPAYVAISGAAAPWVFALAAFAGPLVNFALYGFARIAPDLRKKYRGRAIVRREQLYWQLFGKINLFLGIFNLIPIPGFDGYQVIRYLFSVFG